MNPQRTEKEKESHGGGGAARAGAVPKAARRMPKGIRRTLWIAGALIVIVPLVVLVVLEGYCWYLLRHSAGEHAGVVHRVIRNPVAVPAGWTDAEPFTPETLAAYAEFVKYGKAADRWSCGLGDICLDAREPLEKSAVTAHMTDDALVSMTLCVKGADKALAAFRRLVLAPDFSADLFLGLTPFREEYVTAYHFTWTVYPAHLWSLARTDAEAAVFEALETHRAIRRATKRTMAERGYCYMAADLTVLTAASIVRWKGDPALAARAIEFLDQTPWEPPDPALETPERQVYEWLVGWYLGYLREAKRAGYPVDLARPRSVIEWFELFNRVNADYPRWVARSPLPHVCAFSGQLCESEGFGENPALASGFLGFLATRNLGPWSDAAKEIHMVRAMHWAFGHTFPLKDRPSRRHKTVDYSRRLALNLARLNLGALLHRAETGRWPSRVGDVVPRYVKLEPRTPGSASVSPGAAAANQGGDGGEDPNELFVWSPQLEVFSPVEEYNPFVPKGIL